MSFIFRPSFSGSVRSSRRERAERRTCGSSWCSAARSSGTWRSTKSLSFCVCSSTLRGRSSFWRSSTRRREVGPRAPSPPPLSSWVCGAGEILTGTSSHRTFSRLFSLLTSCLLSFLHFWNYQSKLSGPEKFALVSVLFCIFKMYLCNECQNWLGKTLSSPLMKRLK